MRTRRFIKYVIDAIRDPEREFSERVFLGLTIISEIVVLIAYIADILSGEDYKEIIVLTATLIVVPLVTFTCLYKDRLKIAIRLIVAGLVYAILPALFFFGGGVYGGGVLWIIFAFMYVGLVISGAWRIFILFVLFILTGGCYALQYYFPEIVNEHSREMFFVDSFISLIMVGMVCCGMTWFQNRLFMAENARAKKETERAEELTRSQNRFFSSMSHEIRTPINSILGLNELILRDPTTSEEIAKDAAGIQGAGKMLLSLINDILDFSKMEAGSMDIVPVEYRIGDMLSEIVNMIWLRAQDKGLSFNVSIDPNVPSTLYGDEVRIRQVIINLLNNAVKYTAEGSVELHMESSEIDEKTTELRISISDTGIGIKKEALPYLFDAFKRVDEEKNRHIEGTGLGLSIVKQLVELMNGTVTVNSVYGEGSMFTVTLRQGVLDAGKIGELNIHNQQTIRKHAYESRFKAPEARILIVDDNEMNLEVESRLLSQTEMQIDKALSGKEALEMTLRQRYDTILMDHLMPEMDGIECLEALREQAGGLNRNTPVIVLTANAGSENREQYNRAGFDGYLVKPVSSESLEEMLIRHIDRDKLILSNKMMIMREDIHASSGYSGKLPVVITATSMCDLPDSVVKKLGISLIPFGIRTEEGVFKDGEQMDADELIRYINSGKKATSAPPNESDFTEFFAGVLRKAHHLIHISLTTSMSDDDEIAREAAKSFDNVTVINSGCLSSATGILVLIAHKLAQQNIPIPELVEELETIKQRLRCSFIIDTTDFMASKGLVSHSEHRIAKALNLHPSVRFKNDRYSVSGGWIGSTKRAYAKYIRKAFPPEIVPDSDVAFITYVDIPVDTLLWIRDEVMKIMKFEHIVFKKASAGISSNCGSGTFGILYFVKGAKSYNIGSYIIDEDDERAGVEDDGDNDRKDSVVFAEMRGPEEEAQEFSEDTKEEEPVRENAENTKWYDELEGIDGEIAIRNSGSEEAFRTVLKIFYDSIDGKSTELESFYDSENWKDYTIKIHALKSSAKLIGAMELGERAQLLETAGKEENSDYIREHHPAFIRDYREYGKILGPVFEEEEAEKAGEDKPVADGYLMESVYEGLREAAENMDCDSIEQILKEMEEYAIPENEKDRYTGILEKAGNYDYDGILEILDRKGIDG